MPRESLSESFAATTGDRSLPVLSSYTLAMSLWRFSLPLRCRRSPLRSTFATQSPAPPVAWTYLPGLVPYELGLSIQEHLVAARLDALAALEVAPELDDPEIRKTADTDVLLLLQHKSVFTTGRRDTDALVLEQEGRRLRELGADYVATSRGGQTTYHGPGQLVGYPIVNMARTGVGLALASVSQTERLQMRTRTYVDLLETFLDTILARYDVPVIDSPHVGTFTDASSKIASIGIQIRHRVTSHGFAMNVEDSVKYWFDQIIACGLTDVKATTMNSVRQARDAKVAPLRVDDVVPAVVEEFGRAFGRQMRSLDEDDSRAIRDAIALPRD